MILQHGPDTVAAFIAEPVMGAGGVIVPPATYFEKIQAVLTKYDVLLIADEVITGFGRLGQMFGSPVMGMKPDTMSLAKAITSSYQPLSAVLLPEHMYQAMLDESRKIGVFGHGNTYAGHPVAAAVANKTLEIYQRDNTVGHVQTLIPGFQKRLRAFADHPLVGEARGVGLVGGLELVADKAAKRAFAPKQAVAPKAVFFGQQEGVIIRAIGDTLAICPPLIITAEEVEEMFDRIARALDKTEEWVRKEGLRG
jgi:4-aminobutyrate---pyruvate transaminase